MYYASICILAAFIIFHGKSFFEKKIFNSVFSVCFLCPENAHVAQNLLQSRWNLDYYKCVGVTAIKKLKVVGSKPNICHLFHLFLDTPKPLRIF